jgi:predicted DNA-binding protein (UPF0278 family)
MKNLTLDTNMLVNSDRDRGITNESYITLAILDLLRHCQSVTLSMLQAHLTSRVRREIRNMVLQNMVKKGIIEIFNVPYLSVTGKYSNLPTIRLLITLPDINKMEVDIKS